MARELTLSDLISTLQDIQDRLPEDQPDVTVRVAYQPSWPLRGVVTGAVAPEDLLAAQGLDEPDPDEPVIVWLAIDAPPYDENPYAPSEAFEAATWT